MSPSIGGYESDRKGLFMKISRCFRSLSKFEWCLWLSSAVVVTASFLFSPSADALTLLASLIGVTALIFVAKGYVVGQILTVVFALVYGVISFCFRYYGEMITYLGMTSPIAVLTVISWMKHPFQKTAEVEVNRLTKRQLAAMGLLTITVTGVFYFVLKALGNANLLFSTVSVATSFVASCLTFYRSDYYAVGYAANDVVLIILWVLASAEDSAYLPMVVCFCVFFINDLYGFVNWRRMKARQQRDAGSRKAPAENPGQ